MDPFEFMFVFMKAGAITFGGLGSMPVLHQDLIQLRGLGTDAQLAKAVAVGRLSPGPTGMYVVSFGYLIWGWWGALLALLGSVLPPLIVLPLAPVLRRTMHKPWVSGTIRGIALGSSGLLLYSGTMLALPPGFSLAGSGALSLSLVALGFLLTRSGRIHPALVLGIAGAAGLVLATLGW